MPLQAQSGVKNETTVGTAVVVNEFYPVLTDTMKPVVITTKAAGLTANASSVQRWDQMSRVVSHWEGGHSFTVLDKGFAPWLGRILGTVTTGTTGGDGQIPYTGTISSLCGASYTLQTNKKTGVCASADQAFTYAGCKTNTWELAMDNQGLLTLTLALLAQSGTSATALATASYLSGARPYSWGSVVVTVGGVTIPVKSFKISGDNKLTGDSYLDGTFSEPAQTAILDNLTVELTPDWTTATKTVYDASIATDDTNLKAIVITLTSPRIIGGTTHASMVFTMPDVSIDAPPPDLTGPAKFAPTITGTIVQVSTDVPLTVAYIA